MKKNKMNPNKLFKRGKFTELEKQLQDLLLSNSWNLKYLIYLGRIKLLSNNLNEAEDIFLKAYKLKSKNKAVNHYLAQVYYRMGRFDEASHYYKAIGRESVAKKMASFRESKPYFLENHEKDTKIKFICSEPLPVVEVIIKGKKANFFLDTGGAELILDNEFAKNVGAEIFGKEIGSFAGGKNASIQHGKISSMKLGSFRISNIPINIMQIKTLAKETWTDIQIDGTIGTTFLYQFLASIDYPNGQLILREKNEKAINSFKNEMNLSEFYNIPFWLEEDHYMLSWGKINKTDPQLFFIDTGLVGGGFVAPKSTLKKANIKLNKKRKMEYSGGGGKTYAIPFDIETLSLGELQQKNLRGLYFKNFQLENIFGFHIGGLISHEFFKNFTFTMDFSEMNIYLSRNNC